MRPGIQEWRNPRNRLFILRIATDADPHKRSPEGKLALEQIRAEIGRRAFAREYELDWSAPEGEPVIPEFSQTVHVQRVTVDPLRRLLRWWDFGFVSPVVLFAQLSPEGQVRVVREVCPFNTPLDHLLPMVFATTRDLIYDPRKVFDAGDPAATSQTDLGSAAEVCVRHGITLHTARPGTEVSYTRLRGLLLKQVHVHHEGTVPALVIDPACRNLIEALSGAFHLTEHPPYRPVKVHPYKDVVDALRYGLDNLDAAASDRHEVSLKTLATSDIQPLYGAY